MNDKDFSQVRVGYLVRLKRKNNARLVGYVMGFTKKYVILSNRGVRTAYGAFREPGFWNKLPGEKQYKAEFSQWDGFEVLEKLDY